MWVSLNQSFNRRSKGDVCEILCNHNRSWSLPWIGGGGVGGGDDVDIDDDDDDDDDDVVVDRNEDDGLYMLRNMWFYSINRWN